MRKEERLALAQQAREEVRAQNPDMTEEDAIELAIRVQREAVGRLVRDGRVSHQSRHASSS